jgi:hypothetical protein
MSNPIGDNMKKLLIIALVLLATPVFAAPFLVSDPNPADEQVTNFKLSFDGGAYVDSAPVGGAIRYDLAGISVGTHSVVAKACNVWDCSVDSAPFPFVKRIPGAPTLRIAP